MVFDNPTRVAWIDGLLVEDVMSPILAAADSEGPGIAVRGGTDISRLEWEDFTQGAAATIRERCSRWIG